MDDVGSVHVPYERGVVDEWSPDAIGGVDMDGDRWAVERGSGDGGMLLSDDAFVPLGLIGRWLAGEGPPPRVPVVGDKVRARDRSESRPATVVDRIVAGDLVRLPGGCVGRVVRAYVDYGARWFEVEVVGKRNTERWVARMVERHPEPVVTVVGDGGWPGGEVVVVPGETVGVPRRGDKVRHRGGSAVGVVVVPWFQFEGEEWMVVRMGGALVVRRVAGYEVVG